MARKIKRRGRFWVYMVRSCVGTYYTGYTIDLEKRIEKHSRGTGAKSLRGKGPVELVWSQEYRNFKCATNRERAIKQLTRAQKERFLAQHSAPGAAVCPERPRKRD